MENNLDNLKQDYDLNLQEQIAKEDAIIDKSSLKTEFPNLNWEIESLKKQISSLAGQRNFVLAQIEGSAELLEQSYAAAEEYYQTTKAWFEFKVFLLNFCGAIFCLFSLFLFQTQAEK